MTFSELEVGHKEHFSICISSVELEMFRRLTGDDNTLHTEQNVVYGMLSIAFLSPFAGVHFLGENAILMDVSVEFPNVLRLLDGEQTTLDFQAVIVEKNEIFKFIVLKVNAASSGVQFLRGKMRVGVRQRWA